MCIGSRVRSGERLGGRPFSLVKFTCSTHAGYFLPTSTEQIRPMWRHHCGRVISYTYSYGRKSVLHLSLMHSNPTLYENNSCRGINILATHAYNTVEQSLKTNCGKLKRENRISLSIFQKCFEKRIHVTRCRILLKQPLRNHVMQEIFNKRSVKTSTCRYHQRQ